MKFTKKLKATIITTLALITMTPNCFCYTMSKQKSLLLTRNHSLKNLIN